MKTFILSLFLCLITMVACGLLGGDDSPDIPGKIVFSAKDSTGTYQIYTMNANGSELKQLTHFPPSGGGSQPSWSPDGTRIVFANYTNATTLGPYLYVMDFDGSNMRPLKRTEGSSVKALVGSLPDWSPDGTKIAYQVCTNCELGGGNYEIFYVEVEGEAYDSNQIHTITDHPASDTNPTWSSDGSYMAFTSDRAYPEEGGSDLYVINADGSNLKRLTKNGKNILVGGIAWHPNGEKIYFSVNGVNTYGLYIYNLKNENINMPKLTTEGIQPLRWSKNGKYLLFTKTKTYPKDVLYIFNNETDNLQQIPFKSRQLLGADWFTPKMK